MNHCTPIRIAVLISFLSCLTFTEAKVVTESQAFMIAEQLISLKGEKNIPKRFAVNKMPNATPSTYYIFTGSDGKGFAIISAEDIVRPVLGYSANAELTTDGELPVPLIQWLNDISSQIEKARENGIQQSHAVAEQWKAASIGNTIVKLETAEWGQGYPFYNQCPNDQGERCITGCVPTAYAILMRYYRYPLTGRGNTKQYTTSTKGIKVVERSLNHVYDWDNMPMKYTAGKYTTTQATNVATLMADIGAALKVDYTTYNTTGRLGQGTLFSNFDYHPGISRRKDAFSADEWGKMIRNELDLNRPVIYRASNPKEGGHAFILDGYTDNNYFSVNWGWGGAYNGFFTLDALMPNGITYNSAQVAYLNTIPFPSNDTAAEASLNGVDYPTLTSAIDDAPQDGTPATINLLTDIQVESLVIPAGNTITLNISDHTINMEYGIMNYGNLTVKGTKTSHMSTHQNTAVLQNYGELNIIGGTYTNNYTYKDSIDYRRCVWTNKETRTTITDVTFESPSQVVCTNGKTTIKSGTFTCIGNDAVISNYSSTDTLSILGGTFRNTGIEPEDIDYRRCIWTTTDSHTLIDDGTFESPYQVICTNGKMIINSGNFTCHGRNSVISNYNNTDTLIIRGGTFLNDCENITNQDYRRCLWTAENSYTIIGKAEFNIKYGNQSICFNGDAIINGAVINNENGYLGCLAFSNATVTIDDCKLSAEILFYEDSGSEIVCKGGLYSAEVEDNFLAEGYECIQNTNAETCIKYPYIVQGNGLGIAPLMIQDNHQYKHIYNASGILSPSMQKGINIIHSGNGKVQKLFKR